MKLLIDIPKEFEQHFQKDKFEDSLTRLSADAHLLAGLYEQETVSMLIYAFKYSILVPPHGRLIDADALPKYTGYALSAVEVASAVENASAIIQADLAKEGE